MNDKHILDSTHRLTAMYFASFDNPSTMIHMIDVSEEMEMTKKQQKLRDTEIARIKSG